MGVALPLEGTFLPRSGICHSTLIYVLCEDYNDPWHSHWRSVMGYSYLLMMLSGLPLHYYRYLFVAYVG